MSHQQQSKICKGCHSSRESWEFLNERGVVLKKCSKCRSNIKKSCSRRKPNMIIRYSDITETVYNSLTSLSNTNELYEGEDELEMSFDIELSTLINVISESNGNENIENINFEVGRYIISLISEGDGYVWTYHDKNQKKDSLLLIYYCNCRIELEKKSTKHPSLDKQRDTPTYLKRYHCKGTVNIEILSSLDYINIEYSHKILHPRPVHVKTTLEIQKFIQNNINCLAPDIWRQIRENKVKGYENITVQQIYYWWSVESRKEYCRNSDQLLSAKLLLAELNQEIIININFPTPALGFLTELFYKLSQINLDAIEIDATYGTNNMEWELYTIMGVIDGTGFPLSYLLISAGKNRNITGILTSWMQTLKERNFKKFPIILTDKDFAEINAAQMVWPEAQIQLCAWHVQRAIKQRLASNKQSVYYSYNPKIAHEQCSAIDPNWGVTNSPGTVFCPLDLRETVLKLVNEHFNRHMLLPRLDGTFAANASEIWKECVSEMIQFCKNNNLLQLWIYFWKEWYTKNKWNLWAQASNEKISHIKTTMIVESHWRHIKRDYLYKFHKPRIDHLCYILVKRVINEQLHRIQLLQQGRYLVEWRKEFKKEWKKHEKKVTEINGRYLTNPAQWICSCPAYIQSRFFLCKHLINSVEKAEAIFFKKV
jgi:hypothetical protein